MDFRKKHVNYIFDHSSNVRGNALFSRTVIILRKRSLAEWFLPL